MTTEMTFRPSRSGDSQRILYTPSSFARSCLLHLQEAGTLQALEPHTSQRSNLSSYLFFIVLEGEGQLEYEHRVHRLSKGSCVFIDCRKPYAHATSQRLWKLMWVHFDGVTMPGIYAKYCERGGLPAFVPADVQEYIDLLQRISDTATAEDYVRDMHINELLATLLSQLMQSGWSPADQRRKNSRQYAISDVKFYLDQHYTDRISLDELSERFFINKFYLTRLFREQYGSSIVSYLLALRVSRAKELLRFTQLSVEQIGLQCGFPDSNYFSRTFRRIEGISPTEYRKRW